MLSSLLASAGQEVDSVTGNVVPYVTIPESLLYALVGFVVTFIGVIILIFFVWLCGKIINSAAMRTKKKPKAQEAPAAPPVAAEGEGALDEHIRVAIIAAVAAYYASENSTCEFKVKRIKRL